MFYKTIFAILKSTPFTTSNHDSFYSLLSKSRVAKEERFDLNK